MKKPPHILQAAHNLSRLRENLSAVLDEEGNRRLEAEHMRNVVGLYKLGFHFLEFAKKLDSKDWRNIVSRCYYAAYNMRRAVHLWREGIYSTDPKEHQNVGTLPRDFPSVDYYAVRLRDMREDRNTCDYDHEAVEKSLVLQDMTELIQFVEAFSQHVRTYLHDRGVKIGN